ncbi:MAG: hypothetical protein M0Z69_12020, partial [Actinomycetota bacterium]|nr:hypothetical protein [Actinomycetota bacterium]
PPGSFEEIVEDILREVDEAEQQPVTLASFDTLDPDEMGARLRGAPAIDLAGVEETLLAVAATREQLYEHPLIEGAFLVEDDGGNKVAVTFNRRVVEENAPEMRLLTFGEPLFDLVLRRAGVV